MEAKELREISCDVLDHIQINKEELLAVLKHVNIDKSPGPDRLHPHT